LKVKSAKESNGRRITMIVSFQLKAKLGGDENDQHNTKQLRSTTYLLQLKSECPNPPQEMSSYTTIRQLLPTNSYAFFPISMILHCTQTNKISNSGFFDEMEASGNKSG
jgi:hypothetical protein